MYQFFSGVGLFQDWRVCQVKIHLVCRSMSKKEDTVFNDIFYKGSMHFCLVSELTCVTKASSRSSVLA